MPQLLSSASSLLPGWLLYLFLWVTGSGSSVVVGGFCLTANAADGQQIFGNFCPVESSIPHKKLERTMLGTAGWRGFFRLTIICTNGEQLLYLTHSASSPSCISHVPLFLTCGRPTEDTRLSRGQHTETDPPEDPQKNESLMSKPTSLGNGC